jgi:hypothetical protein
MSWFLVAVLLAGAPESAIPEFTSQHALAQMADAVQTGTLVVSRGDCLAVKIYSASSYTHIAAVVIHEGETLVYDATGGAGVRKQSLLDYFTSQGDQTLHFFHPKQALSEKRAESFERHLECQLGRPYAIHHYLTGERAAGLHCSEYVTDALIAAEMLRAKQPPRVSPASLVEGILKTDLYREGESLQLVPESPERPASQGWCARLWFDTKRCTCTCCSKMRGWFFCK